MLTPRQRNYPKKEIKFDFIYKNGIELGAGPKIWKKNELMFLGGLWMVPYYETMHVSFLFWNLSLLVDCD